MRGPAALLACLGAASAQFLGVTPPRIVNSPCPSVGLLPSTTASVATTSSALITYSVEAWCDNKPVSGLVSTQCNALDNWVVMDDGDEVSTLESELTVTLEPGSPQTLILIDLSNSVSSVLGQNSATKQAVVDLINRLFDKNVETGTNLVAVHAFDGRRDTQMVHDWTTDRASLVAAVNALECDAQSRSGGRFCQDPSTNLYGTLVWAAGEIQNRVVAGQSIRRTSRGMDGSIVVFTDGDDLAGLSTATAARAAITNAGVVTFAVGVLSQSSMGWTPEQQRRDLLAITGDFAASFLGPNLQSLPALAVQVADHLVNYYGRTYRITYCSPRRSPNFAVDQMMAPGFFRPATTSGDHYVSTHVRQGNTIGPQMEFIPGQRVWYTPANNMMRLATITAVSVNPGVGTFYQLEGVATQVPGAQLAHHYSSTGFTSPAQCPLKVQNTARTTPCQSPAATSLAPYTCTGGGLYTCSANTCGCAASEASGQCAAGNCVQQVQRVMPPLYVDRACATGLPAGGQTPMQFTRSQDSTLSLVFAPKCNDGSSVGGLTFSPCSDLSSITIEETDPTGQFPGGFAPISLYESRLQITCLPKPAHMASVMLLDLSDSVLRGFGSLQRLKESAVAYLDGLSPEVTSHVVAVYTFDGSPQIRLLANFGTVSSARTAIQAMECGVDRCTDPSTNLNGAIVHGNVIVRDYLRANPNAKDGEPRQGFIALFSDGADQARYYSDEVAAAAARNGTGIFAVGIQGEVRNSGALKRGADIGYLRRIAPNGVFVMTDPAELQESFKNVGSAVASAAAGSYRLEYCSPKRSGMQRVRVYLNHQGQQTFWEQEFDANFNCANGACNRCLGGIRDQAFQCGAQPGPMDQNFACENNQNPVSRDGYCRCPCSNPAQYPPASVPGPGPIVCEKQGTCSRGDRVSCSSHGGLGAPVRNFTRFGINTNSRVSMEFTPECSDGFPMPMLKMSVCDSLSDFRVLEFNPDTGVDEPVSKFESLPRLQCFPDVVSIILLDTSGSVRFGGGEQAIRDAVIQYLDRIQSSLNVKHSAAIYAFDGRNGVQPIQGFTSSKDRLKNAMNSWRCDGANYCADPSTNLYGAIVSIEGVIRAEVGDMVWRQKPYLIVFTDGTDQAGRVQESFALQQLQLGRDNYELEVYGVGLVGETNNGLMGLDRPALERLAPSGVFVADVLGSLSTQFEQVAQDIVTKTGDSDSTSYRIDYCSPKRSGMTRVTLVLQHEGGEVRWVREFDANTFDCSTEACGQCLEDRNSYSCQNQPGIGPGGGEQQFFTCTDGEPLVHEGQCKCPCPAGVPYPPPATAAPVTTPTPGSSNRATAPIFTPSGGTFANAQTITLTCTNTGATIYYTVNGGMPMTTSTRYTGPFAVNTQGTTTVRAICVVPGLTTSDPSTATYTIGTGPISPPTSGSCSSLTTGGFTKIPQLNQVYTQDPSRVVGGFPIYNSADGAYFMYFCTVSVALDQGNQWRIAQTSNYAFVSSTSNPICNSVARSSTPGSNVATLSGPWTQRATTETNFDPVQVMVTCGGGGVVPPTGGPTGSVLQPTISSQATSTIVTVQNAVGTIATGAGATVTSATCTSSNTAIFQNGRVDLLLNGNTGNIQFTPTAQGTANVQCVLRDSLGRTGTLSNIQIIIGSGTGGDNARSLRMPARGRPATFNQVGFMNGVRNVLGSMYQRGRVNWVCPETDCFNNANCPTANCVNQGVTLERAFEELQSSDVVYVDFDLQDQNGVEFTTFQYQQAASMLNQDVDNFNNGRDSQLAPFAPQGGAIVAGPGTVNTFPRSSNTPAPANDDDGLETWHWVVIIAAVVLCIAVIIALLCFKGGKKAKDTQPAQQEYQAKEMSSSERYYEEPTKRDDYTYETTDYSADYAYDAVADYMVGERVQALYLDGQWYDGTVDDRSPDGTYGVRWYDGQYSDGIPADQIRRVS